MTFIGKLLSPETQALSSVNSYVLFYCTSHFLSQTNAEYIQQICKMVILAMMVSNNMIHVWS